MKLYFSGVTSEQEAQMLRQAGALDFLCDLEDWPNIAPLEKRCFAIDSGAYRAWKAGEELTVPIWKEKISGWLSENESAWPELRFCVMPDVLGNAAESWQRWVGKPRALAVCETGDIPIAH